jgi:hypothetical protein
MRIASAAQTLTEKPKRQEIQEKGRANREINMGRQAKWASEIQTDRQRAPRRASATKSRAVARAINRIARRRLLRRPRSEIHDSVSLVPILSEMDST